MVPESVEPEQFAALRNFKEWCRERGLVYEYDDLADFRALLSRHLAQVIIDKFQGGRVPLVMPVAAGPPNLSDEARELLLEAAGSDGTVMQVSVMGGDIVQAAGREFTTRGDRRAEARWRAAVKELESMGFIEDRGGKHEVFFVTNAGYEAAAAFGS